MTIQNNKKFLLLVFLLKLWSQRILRSHTPAFLMSWFKLPISKLLSIWLDESAISQSDQGMIHTIETTTARRVDNIIWEDSLNSGHHSSSKKFMKARFKTGSYNMFLTLKKWLVIWCSTVITTWADTSQRSLKTTAWFTWSEDNSLLYPESTNCLCTRDNSASTQFKMEIDSSDKCTWLPHLQELATNIL